MKRDYSKSVLHLIICFRILTLSNSEFNKFNQGHCSTGQFECDGSKCIQQYQVCNSQPDCKDATDEKGCDCLLVGLIPCNNEECEEEESVCIRGVETCKGFEDQVNCSRWNFTPDISNTTSSPSTTVDFSEDITSVSMTSVTEMPISKKKTNMNITLNPNGETKESSTATTLGKGEKSSETTTATDSEIFTSDSTTNLPEKTLLNTTEGTTNNDIYTTTGFEEAKIVRFRFDDFNDDHEDTFLINDPQFQIITTEENESETSNSVTFDALSPAPKDTDGDRDRKLRLLIPCGVIAFLIICVLAAVFIFRKRRKSATYQCRS